MVGRATAVVTFIWVNLCSFVFSAICARKSHDQYATSHTTVAVVPKMGITARMDDVDGDGGLGMGGNDVGRHGW
jgi:hypothetical protein